MKKNRRRPENLTKPLQTKFHTDPDRYEYIARLAFGRFGGNQQVFEERMFRPGWREELNAARAKHRALGIPDERFLHPSVFRERGLHPRIMRKLTAEMDGL